MQDKLNLLLNDIRLYEKGIKQFSNKDTQTQLTKYLLKTVATDLVNNLFSFVAQENFTHSDDIKEITAEVIIFFFCLHRYSLILLGLY